MALTPGCSRMEGVVVCQWAAGAAVTRTWGLFAMPRVLPLSSQPLGRPQGAPAPGIRVLMGRIGEEGVVLPGHLRMLGDPPDPQHSAAVPLCRAARTPLLSQQRLLPPGRA